MIEFRVRTEAGMADIRWLDGEPHRKVFLFVEPVTPIKLVDEGSLRVEERPLFFPPMKTLFKSLRRQEIPFSLPGNAIWCFSVYGTADRSGEPIVRQSAYVGQRFALCLKQRPHRSGFEELLFTCRYRLEKEMFWLSFPAMEAEGRFYLPPMQKEDQDGFTTSCLVRKGAYGRLKLCLHPSVEDCVYLREG